MRAAVAPSPWRRGRLSRARTAAVAFLLLAAACRQSPSRPNVLLITIDTLRPDALGWIAGTNETPAIDAFARDGARFRTAVTPVPLTLPAHVSVMTGLLPRRHGVRDNGDVLPRGPRTLAEGLRDAGYATAAFISGYPLRGLFGIDRGFARYDDTLPSGAEGWVERPAPDTTAAALAWLRTAPSPWFVWVHYYDPHDPYVAHAEFPRPGPRGAYDSEVAYVDHAIGTLLGEARGMRGSLLTVLTADHAESFGEHGEWLHGFFLYDTTTVVPLVIQFPGRVRSMDVEAPVRLVDVAPTIYDLLGIALPPDLDGASLVRALDGGVVPPVAARLETLQPWREFGWSPLRAVRTADWKLVEAPRPELYDLRRDPEETRNVIESRDADARSLRAELAPLEADTALQAERSTDPTLRARLEALGYLTVTSAPPPAGLADPKDRLDARTRLLEAEAVLRRGAFRDAVARFDAVLASDPGNRFATLRSGVALLKAGDVAAAVPRLQQAVQNDPEQPETRYALADALTRAGRYEPAVVQWQEVTRLQPRRVAAWSNLGTVLGVLGRWSEARAALERAVALEPDDPRLLVNLALIERRAGDDAAAVGHFQHAAERSGPGGFTFSATLGLGLARLGRGAEARTWLLRARPGEPDFAAGRLELARMLAASGDVQDASRMLAEALTAAPELRGEAARDARLAGLLR